MTTETTRGTLIVGEPHPSALAALESGQPVSDRYILGLAWAMRKDWK